MPTRKTTVYQQPKEKSETQKAYEGAIAGDPKAFKSLLWMCIVKCRRVWPPASTDKGAKSWNHAHRRYRTSRYNWIQAWLTLYLKARPRPRKETGAGVVQRCFWRLKKLHSR